MESYIASFDVLFIIILSFVLFNENTEETSSEPIQQKIIKSNINTVENKKPPVENHFQ